MASDMDKATDMIKNLLSDEEMRNKLGSLLGNFVSEEQNDNPNEIIDAEIKEEEPQTDFNIDGLLNFADGGDKKRAALLSALRPYLNERRSAKIDSAITLMKIAEMSSMMGINKLLK